MKNKAIFKANKFANNLCSIVKLQFSDLLFSYSVVEVSCILTVKVDNMVSYGFNEDDKPIKIDISLLCIDASNETMLVKMFAERFANEIRRRFSLLQT